MIESFTQLIVHIDADPITDIFTKNWAAVGGWSLFFGLIILNVFGFFRGWVVPGWMYRNLSTILDKAMEQNRTLLAAAEITKHFFEATAPKRRPRKVNEVKRDVEEKADSKVS